VRPLLRNTFLRRENLKRTNRPLNKRGKH
jgi:hypothetical protein